MNPIQKTLDKKESELPKQTSKHVDNKEIIQTGRKNRKLEEKKIPQDQKEKSPYRQSTRLRNHPRNNYKTFIPQSKILRKIFLFRNHFKFN